MDILVPDSAPVRVPPVKGKYLDKSEVSATLYFPSF
jgi:hypothetical protein